MSSFINDDNDNDDVEVLFSYQGSFGPPTYGHYKSMLAFAEQLSKEYNGKIKMLFMMSPGGSKKHLFPTINSRREVLQKFCDMLNIEKDSNDNIINKNITFYVGKEEINIVKNENKSVGTIETIDELAKNYKKDTKICLGMGLDNAYQLPYWANIDQYKNKVHKIYVVPRNPTEEDIEKTRRFEVNDESVEMRFDVTVPWTNNTFLHLWTFKTPIFTELKKTKNVKSIMMVLLFPLLF